ncbi:hypothetical protein ACQRIT_004426 [Beauveria bassiana]
MTRVGPLRASLCRFVHLQCALRAKLSHRYPSLQTWKRKPHVILTAGSKPYSDCKLGHVERFDYFTYKIKGPGNYALRRAITATSPASQGHNILA